MKCTRCQIDRPMSMLTFKPSGSLVVGGGAMKTHDAICAFCMSGSNEPETPEAYARKLETEAVAGEREPGCDDDLDENGEPYPF